MGVTPIGVAPRTSKGGPVTDIRGGSAGRAWASLGASAPVALRAVPGASLDEKRTGAGALVKVRRGRKVLKRLRLAPSGARALPSSGGRGALRVG